MKQQTKNVKPVSVSLRPDLALWARVYAAKKNMSRSQFIAALLESAQKQAQAQVTK